MSKEARAETRFGAPKLVQQIYILLLNVTSYRREILCEVPYLYLINFF